MNSLINCCLVLGCWLQSGHSADLPEGATNPPDFDTCADLLSRHAGISSSYYRSQTGSIAASTNNCELTCTGWIATDNKNDEDYDYYRHEDDYMDHPVRTKRPPSSTGDQSTVTLVNNSATVVAPLEDMHSCGGDDDALASLCYNTTCRKVLTDSQGECDRNTNTTTTVALQGASECQVLCVDELVHHYDYAYRRTRSVLVINLPDRQPCNKGKWLCSNGFCLKPTHFPQPTCSK